MDDLFDYPLESEKLREALDIRLQQAYQLVEQLSHLTTDEEFDSEFARWDDELQGLGDQMTSILDDVADEVEASMEQGQPTCFGGLVAVRLMEWARSRFDFQGSDPANLTQLGLDRQVFVCGWQFLQMIQSAAASETSIE